MPTRKLNPRRLKQLRAYTTGELAACLKVHKNTIRNWQRKGLEPIDSGKPVLFLGSAVGNFLTKRNSARKRPCPPSTFYCLGCRVPRPPARGTVEYVPITATSGNLRAFCASCEATMCRRVSRAALAMTMPGLDIQFAEAKARLITNPSPSLNCDFKRKAAA